MTSWTRPSARPSRTAANNDHKAPNRQHDATNDITAMLHVAPSRLADFQGVAYLRLSLKNTVWVGFEWVAPMALLVRHYCIGQFGPRRSEPPPRTGVVSEGVCMGRPFRFDSEFRAHAVDLERVSRKPRCQIASDIGISLMVPFLPTGQVGGREDSLPVDGHRRGRSPCSSLRSEKPTTWRRRAASLQTQNGW